ncbi:MAG: hypothetical protein ACOCRX_00165 [Candidatus Woesearchaeota archaeon]
MNKKIMILGLLVLLVTFNTFIFSSDSGDIDESEQDGNPLKDQVYSSHDGSTSESNQEINYNKDNTCEDNDGIIILNQRSSCESIEDDFKIITNDLDESYQSCLIEFFWDCDAKNYCSDGRNNEYWVFLEGSEIILKNQTNSSGFSCNKIYSNTQCNRLRCIFESTPDSERISVPSTYSGSFISKFNTEWSSFDSGRNLVQKKCDGLDEKDCRNRLKESYNEEPLLKDCLESQDNSRFRDRYCRGVSSALTDIKSTTGLEKLFDNDKRYSSTLDFARNISNFINGVGYDEESIKGWDYIFSFMSDDDDTISGLLDSINFLKEPFSKWNKEVNKWKSPIKSKLLELCESSWETPFDSTYGSDLIALNRDMAKDSYLDYSAMKYHLLNNVQSPDLKYFYYVEFEFGHFEKNVSYGLCLGKDKNLNHWNSCDGRLIGRYDLDKEKYVMRNLTKGETISSFKVGPKVFLFNSTTEFKYISVCFDSDFSWLNGKCATRELLDYTNNENIPNYEVLHEESEEDNEDSNSNNNDKPDKDVGGKW